MRRLKKGRINEWMKRLINWIERSEDGSTGIGTWWDIGKVWKEGKRWGGKMPNREEYWTEEEMMKKRLIHSIYRTPTVSRRVSLTEWTEEDKEWLSIGIRQPSSLSSPSLFSPLLNSPLLPSFSLFLWWLYTKKEGSRNEWKRERNGGERKEREGMIGWVINEGIRYP